MAEQHTAGRFTSRSANAPSDEWLGGESHVPDLSRELWQRHRSTNLASFRWAVSSIFIAGFALGTLITLLLSPRRHSS